MVQDDLRRANRDLSKGKEEMTTLTSKIEELNLHNDSSERELKKVVKNKQVCMCTVCMWGERRGSGVDRHLGEGTEGGGQEQTGLYA